MKSALILYPDQLYPAAQLPKVKTVIIVEEPLFFGMDQQYPLKQHKQKLILHFASMRRYVEEVLWPAGYDVDYVQYDVFNTTSDVLDRTKKFEQVYIFEPSNEIIAERLLKTRREYANLPPLEFLPSPNFFLNDHEIRQYFAERHKHLFADFYQWQRERFNILLGQDYKPLGGKWMLDGQKPSALPDNQALPSFAAFGDNKHVKDAIKYVLEHFHGNPGSTDFIWPTSHGEAAAWLSDFIEHRLEDYGTYHDTIDPHSVWTYHSVLSSSINIGLLSPVHVLNAVLRKHAGKQASLESLERFTRNILGWREFARGAYLMNGEHLRASNPFKQQRRMTNAWYTGQTHVTPFDDLVSKLQRHAYVHQAERFMVAGNLMTLCEIHPDDIHRWYSEMFIDAYDWSVTPNVYSLSNFTDSNAWTALPSICASNTILHNSSYQRGEWADIWDGLFWRFIEKHRTAVGKNPSLRVMVHRLDRLDPDRKRIIGYRAEDFLSNFTR